MSVHLFGIRHHGPGCARALRSALGELQPDCLLVEGPPDAQSVLPLMMSEAMVPPVALLIYRPDQPQQAVYYPFTHFSPEWQALRYGFSQGIATRFFDLPQAIQFAIEPEASNEPVPDATTEPEGMQPSGANQTAVDDPPQQVRDDPLALLAEAAGYSDHELWWEQQIEQRQDMRDLFVSIREAMTELRAGSSPRRTRENEPQREAHMRQQIRAAQREGCQRIAVVCGAWHVPALEDTQDAGADTKLLKGLRAVNVLATWIPWTNSRLAYRSGYGAGVTAPGWYSHLWHAPDRLTIRWLAQTAQVLRDEGFDTSSANVIEAVRLAEALAAIRGLPMPGLAEMHEATQTVLCNGEAAPMQIIRQRIEIGEMMGAVPAETPAVPLQRDLERLQKQLRLEMTGEIKQLDLDQRKETDLARSHLLHRLQLLGIAWGKPQRVANNKHGTFHEYWALQWQVEFVVNIIEANVWGNTVAGAATAYAQHEADEARDLPQLTTLLQQAILAELPAAIAHVLWRVQGQSAIAADVQHLMRALPPLAQVARYTDVRATKSEQILPVIDALFQRMLVGLSGACASLDDDAAQAMSASIDAVQSSIQLLDRAAMRDAWHATIAKLIDDATIHGLVRGQCCRLLLDAGVLDSAGLHVRARHALSPVMPAPQAAAWVEGVLRGHGEVLLTQDGLWDTLDLWLRELDADTFVAMLPLLRRSFAAFDAPLRRRMGHKVKHLAARGKSDTDNTTVRQTTDLDRERADLTLPMLAKLLGVQA